MQGPYVTSAPVQQVLNFVNPNFSTLILFSIQQPELIRYWQYECEEHFVQTKDGYTLGIHRIPRGRDEAPSDKLKPAVLMLHGIISSSSAFSFGPPDKSLAYLLADAGWQSLKKSIRVALDY